MVPSHPAKQWAARHATNAMAKMNRCPRATVRGPLPGQPTPAVRPELDRGTDARHLPPRRRVTANRPPLQEMSSRVPANPDAGVDADAAKAAVRPRQPMPRGRALPRVVQLKPALLDAAVAARARIGAPRRPLSGDAGMNSHQWRAVMTRTMRVWNSSALRRPATTRLPRANEPTGMPKTTTERPTAASTPWSMCPAGWRPSALSSPETSTPAVVPLAGATAIVAAVVNAEVIPQAGPGRMRGPPETPDGTAVRATHNDD